MPEQVIFYQLTHKFVNGQQDIPEDARQVIYYSLAIGHHVGVMDCFQPLLKLPLEDYRQWLARLPEGTPRRKLEGLLKFGEIEVNHTHAGEMLRQLEAAGAPWAGTLARCLQAMLKEPALYLMVRKADA